MPGFRPFSLADAIKDSQSIKMNNMKLQNLQLEMDRQKNLKQMVSESRKPTFGRAEGPPSPEGKEPQIQTGTEYDPELHQKKLMESGENEIAAKLQKYYADMNDNQREEFIFNAQEAGKKAFSADTPEKWDAMMKEEVASGRADRFHPFKDREQIINAGRKLEDMLKTDKASSIWGKINPKDFTEKSIDKFSTSKNYADLVPIDKTGGSGSSEFERLTAKINKGDQLTVQEQSRYDTLANVKARMPGSPFKAADIEGKTGVMDARTGKYTFAPDAKLTGAQLRANMSDTQKKSAVKQRRTDSMRNEAQEGTKHFQSQRISVNDAIAAMDSGDNALADTLLGQVMAQVQDSNVRAFQMYSVFDSSYGNAAERVYNFASRFLTGKRTPEERKIIRDTLVKFKKYSDPAAARMRNKYRSLAIDNGLRPFQVVPPDSPEDIKNAIGVSQEDKLNALRLYYPGMFK